MYAVIRDRGDDHAGRLRRQGERARRRHRSKLDKGDVRSGDRISTEGALGETTAPPLPSARDPRFAQVEAQRTQLMSMRGTGLMTNEQIDDALRGLMFIAAGRHWVLNAGSDQWYSSDGGDWKPDTPPG